MRLLVTAGPTREYIDTVRFLSNASSGKLGFAVARAAARRRHAVTLLHGPVDLLAPAGVKAVPVISARDMLVQARRLWPVHDVLIMAAAVADYAPVRSRARKLKKTAGNLTLRLRPTVDILSDLARRATRQVVIGFALEDRAGRRNAEAKLQRKRLDAIVLNRPTTIGSDDAEVEVLIRGEPWRRWRRASKQRIAARLVELAEQLHAKAGGPVVRSSGR